MCIMKIEKTQNKFPCIFIKRSQMLIRKIV